jgi:hypothetical protein
MELTPEEVDRIARRVFELSCEPEIKELRVALNNATKDHLNAHIDAHLGDLALKSRVEIHINDLLRRQSERTMSRYIKELIETTFQKEASNLQEQITRAISASAVTAMSKVLHEVANEVAEGVSDD